MTTSKLRQLFIDFYKKRKHIEIPSAPLIPENDPTTLFNSSGMQPLVPYLLGEKHPQGKRLVNSQKAIRLQDIDEVGNNRHTTFFEMLGNWSLGDYFKKEQLPWVFEFFTEVLGLEAKKLYVSVFAGNESVPKDTESITIWKKIFQKAGIDAKENERIFAYPANKNWWSRSGEPEKMPAGEPGGPDSEVFYDFGGELTLHEHSPYKDTPCHPNCDCGRFLEIGNSVFMQYVKHADGSLKELPQKNVDFGGGLERLVAATNNTPDIFQIDIFTSIIQIIEVHAHQPYGQDKEATRAMRIIADHLRAAAFMIADDVLPANKQQGYILRRLIRRTVVKMYQLNIKKSVSQVGKEIFDAIGHSYKNYYPKLDPNKTIFLNSKIVLTEEIDKFERSLHKALKVLEKHQQIDGKIAFDLLQSYGLPWELTLELASERGQTLDRDEFEKEFKKHQEISRSQSAGMFKGGLADQQEQTVKLHTANHLLQASLRKILGPHVRQKGSNITATRLRFDFIQPRPLTPEEIQQVEGIVNEKIKANLLVTWNIVSFQQAVAGHALFVPGETYPDKVKVYRVGGFSKEVCGGPHVDSTKCLGRFKIIKEEGAGAGVRRIYAVLE